MRVNINTTSVLFIAILFLITTAGAAAPANDNFANAQSIGAGPGVTFNVTTDATREAGEPIHAFNRGGASVWYKFTAPGNGVMLLATGGSNYDTMISVYTGATLANLKHVASMDDYATDANKAQFTFGTQTNVTYYIAIDGHNEEGAGAATGSLRLDYAFSNQSGADTLATPHILSTYPRGNRIDSNVGASKQVGEPDHAGNPGGKSLWFLWHAPVGSNRSYTFTTKGSTKANANGPMNVLLAVYTGSSLATLVPVADASGSAARVTFTPAPDAYYYIAVDGYDFGQGADTGTIQLKWSWTDATKDLDFDLDGRADPTLFRPTAGVWYTLDSITGSMRAVQWGVNGDKPVAGKYDSDDRLDYNVFRPDTATWWTLGSAIGPSIFKWGLTTDIPFNFHGADNEWVGMFRPTNGNWHIYIGAGYTVNFGQNGDIPVPLDYSGDGNDKLVLFRPSTGYWWFLNQMTGEQTGVLFGANGDKPVPADYDGDGRADLAVYRPSEATWYVRRSSDGMLTIQRWGSVLDMPQPGDYDNDGRADFALYRPSDGTWYILRSSDDTPRYIKFGAAGDKPISYSTAAG